MVFHLPWCAAFSITLSPLLGVGGLGGSSSSPSSSSGLFDICVCLHAHGGSSDAIARLVVRVVFSSQPSAGR